MRRCVLIFSCLIVVPPAIAAQDAPEVYTSASAAETVPADLATLIVEFSATRTTPGEAGRASAAQANAIRAALVSIGIQDDSIVTRGYHARLQVAENRVDTTFVATNTMVIRIRDLDLIGQAIDTSLAEGATGVTGPVYSATDVEDVRVRVLESATRALKTRAETIVSALGQSLGPLVEITTEAPLNYGPGLGLNQVVVTRGSDSGTVLQAPAVQVSIIVYGRWKVRAP